MRNCHFVVARLLHYRCHFVALRTSTLQHSRLLCTIQCCLLTRLLQWIVSRSSSSTSLAKHLMTLRQSGLSTGDHQSQSRSGCLQKRSKPSVYVESWNEHGNCQDWTRTVLPIVRPAESETRSLTARDGSFSTISSLMLLPTQRNAGVQ